MTTDKPLAGMSDTLKTDADRAEWSCDTPRGKSCRNPHGCHCREITTLRRLTSRPMQAAEPVAWMRVVRGHSGPVAAEVEFQRERPTKSGHWVPLCTPPPNQADGGKGQRQEAYGWVDEHNNFTRDEAYAKEQAEQFGCRFQPLYISPPAVKQGESRNLSPQEQELFDKLNALNDEEFVGVIKRGLATPPAVPVSATPELLRELEGLAAEATARGLREDTPNKRSMWHGRADAYANAVAIVHRHKSAPSPSLPVGSPFCWVLPGQNNARDGGWIDARIDREGEFTKPLYEHATPSPHPGATVPVEALEALLSEWARGAAQNWIPDYNECADELRALIQQAGRK